jgi:HK97 family phage major capsid protein
MADSAKALREERGKLAHKIKEMNDAIQSEKREFSPEEDANWATLNKDYDALSIRIDRAERVEKINGESEEPEARNKPGRHDASGEQREEPEVRTAVKPTEEQRSLALQAWVLRQLDEGKDLSPEQREAARICGVNPNAREYRIDLERDYRKVRAGERRALSALNDTAGGYAVPEGFVANLEKAMLDFSGVRAVASVQRTSSGEDLNWPTANDTSNSGAILQENIAVGEADPTFGVVTFRAYNYTSKLVRVPFAFLQDSAVDMASLLGSMLGERIGRIHNSHFTTGTGAGQPKGIVTCATAGNTAASATAIAGDDLFGLMHQVDPAYRVGTNAGWMMHDSVLLAVRKLKDGNGNYLWAPGIAGGTPDRLLGYPVFINQSMASTIESAAKTVLFGLLSKYMIRDVAQVRLRRLVERYADQDQEGFVAFQRSDANLLDAGVAPIKYLVH